MLRTAARGKKIPPPKQPDLVPVMDAMFTMIFFLLASSEIVKLNEIGSDLPIMKFSKDSNPEKKELVLRMELQPQSIRLINESDNKELFSSPWGDIGDNSVFDKLNETVKELKTKYPKEERVIVITDLSIKYDSVVKSLDAVRQAADPVTQGTIKLFNQIMFK